MVVGFGSRLALWVAFAGVLSGSASSAIAGTFSVTAPQLFVRGTGAPQTATTQFTAAYPGTAYTLQVFNGGLENDTYELVSSSQVKLNGVTVISPNELNQTTPYLEKPLALAASNSIAVEVRGKPGGAIVINIVGTDNELPTITAQSSPQANAAGWNSTAVLISFHCADGQSGIASCTSPITLAAEGADQMATGTAIDLAANTGTANVTINIDKTLPTIDAATTPAANAADWHRSDVVVSFKCADEFSGIATCTPDATVRAHRMRRCAPKESANSFPEARSTSPAYRRRPPSR